MFDWGGTRERDEWWLTDEFIGEGGGQEGRMSIR